MNTAATKTSKDNLLTLTLILFIITCGLLAFFVENSFYRLSLAIIIGGCGAVIIFQYPPIGISLVILSTPLSNLLPDIPYLSSAAPLFGLVTLTAYILKQNPDKCINLKLSQTELIALLFIFWIVVSNPQASILGNSRSWAVTFVQLLVLLWLSTHFVTSKQDHQMIMMALALGILFSAIIAVIQSGGYVSLTQRAVGLAGGANTAARYFIYGLVLFLYLLEHASTKNIYKVFLIIGILICITGVIFTGSRSGIILLFIVFGYHVIKSFNFKLNSIIISIILILSVFAYFQFVEGTMLTPNAILNSLIKGTDTVGIRYDLLETGWKMFLDQPISGVGIGMFENYFSFYGPPALKNRPFTPHNTYIQVLSETGFIGLLLFLGLILVSIISKIENVKREKNLKQNNTYLAINETWLIILILLLIGALTKTDLVDKFFWFLLGVQYQHHIE